MTTVGFVEGYYDSFAGAQQSMMYLVENLDEIDPVLITSRPGQMNDIARTRGVATDVVWCPDSLNVFEGKLLEGSVWDFFRRGIGYVSYQRSIAQYLRDAGIDVLYCNNPRSLLFFAPAARLLGIPVIWYVRNDAKGGYSGPETLDKFTVRLADYLVCISHGVHDRFENHRVDTSKFRTIHTGVDVAAFDPGKEYETIPSIPPGPTTIVQVAAIHPRKGQDVLVEAVGRVADDLGDFRLVFAGNTPEGQAAYREQLEQRADELGIAEQVIFLGWCDDVPRVLNQSDIFALPSYNEGLPRSILEAMAMGVPAVATPAGGTEELVFDEETGLVVPMEDPAALGDALRRLCTDAALRESMGERARELVVTEFSVESYVDNFEKFLQSVVEKQA